MKEEMKEDNYLHVVVGVISNSKNQILVALRKSSADHGEFWEFPGGKVEVDETAEEALKRELKEEIGILVVSAEPLIKIKHNYFNKKILLDAWSIKKFTGIPYPCESQPMLKWVDIKELTTLKMPEANYAIVKLLDK